MPSLKRQEILRLALEIQRNGVLCPVPCDSCFESGSSCIAMTDDPKRLKCSECVRRGRPCVNLTWTSLDKTREEYQKKVDEDEKLLATVLSRLLRNKTILKQAEDRAKAKLDCLANEMRDAGEEVDAVVPEPFELAPDCPAAASGVALSPTLWATLGMVENFVSPS